MKFYRRYVNLQIKSVVNNLPAVIKSDPKKYVYKTNKFTLIFIMYFIYSILSNMFRPVFRPSTG